MKMPIAYTTILALVTTSLTAFADELDELLQTAPKGDRVDESKSVKDDWHIALDLLAERKYQEAQQKLDKLIAVQGFVTPRRRDFVDIASLTINYAGWIEAEKDSVRGAYSEAVNKVRAAEKALNSLQLEEIRRSANGAVIPPGTKQRIEADRKRWSAELKAANGTRNSIQKTAGMFEQQKFAELERKVSLWISVDDKGEDIETAYILSTVFLDCVGDSDVIRKRSQALQHKRSLLAHANRVIDAISEMVSPLLKSGQKAKAHEELIRLAGEVNTSDLDTFVKVTVITRLQALFPFIAITEWPELQVQASTHLTEDPPVRVFGLQDYDWTQNKPAIKMKPLNMGLGMLSSLGGRFLGGGEAVRVEVESDGFWYLNGTSMQPLRAMAIFVQPKRAQLLGSVRAVSWGSGRPRIRLIESHKGFAYLSAVSGRFLSGETFVRVKLDPDGWWYLEGNGPKNVASMATIVEWGVGHASVDIETATHTWKKGNKPIKMIHQNEGFCFLSSIGGGFNGGGERIWIDIGSDGFWYLHGKTGRVLTRGEAVSIRFRKK